MKRFIESAGRNQGTLFPEYLEDYVAEDNPARIVEAFVEHLGLGKLGFNGAEPAITGRPSYHPSVLLKLYIYGYLNRTQSSRRLEKETQRNVELMWLLGRLTPDFKTIARFRKENGKAIRKVCSQFVLLCRQLNLFSEAMVAIDGSKFKAVNNRDRNYTANKIKRRREQIETGIGRYLSALETADQLEPDIAEAKTGRLQDKIAKLKEQMAQLDSIEAQLQETPDKQISLTDPDARSMATSGRGTGMVGYNAQVAATPSITLSSPMKPPTSAMTATSPPTWRHRPKTRWQWPRSMSSPTGAISAAWKSLNARKRA
jgi:transposase